MDKITFAVPGSSTSLVAPSNIPSGLQGSASSSGTAVFQLTTNLLLSFAAFLALAILIFAGIQWITSGGDSEKLAVAKSRIKYAIIGLVIVTLSFFIVRIVITILGGDSSGAFNPFGVPAASPVASP